MKLKATLTGLIILLLHCQNLRAQDYETIVFDTLDVSIHSLFDYYQPSATRLIDIDHMRLDVEPDFEKRQLKGTAQLDFHPYNKPISTVTLDAKAMEIHRVTLLESGDETELPYSYDDLRLTIDLPKRATKEEALRVAIEYTAKPYSLDEKGIESSAGRGLYFIDPQDRNPYKPTQMWSQGETDANSIWFPTINAPNEQFTHDIHLTVEDRYVTLSNGILAAQSTREDGKRTDHWQQELPHGSHLVMIAAGPFFHYQSEWNGIPIGYYTKPEYASSVARLFGDTPEMLSFFERIFQVDYPWAKYEQMVVEDYISGAMENTTAAIFYDAYYADTISMIDWDYNGTIAHEIAHQWFGDLVACESWAHLALNESFATYAEYLWLEYKNGKDAADELLHEQLFTYLNEFVYKSEPIIQYYFEDADEDLFDAHRYEKGSCVLHMLREFLGDEDFFEGIRVFLEEYAFQSAEIHQLRIAFEKVSGKDLHWFFEQWFMQPGHPVVQIAHEYDSTAQKLTVNIRQIQDLVRYSTFRFPLYIDIYSGGEVMREKVWVDNRKEEFDIPMARRPDLVNVDASKTMLWEKEVDQSMEEWMFQYYHAPLFVDQVEALSELTFYQWDLSVRKLYLEALNNPNGELRRFAIAQLIPDQYHAQEGLNEKLVSLAEADNNSIVRRDALILLSLIQPAEALRLAKLSVKNDPSRMVKAAALAVIQENDPESAVAAARPVFTGNSNTLKRAISDIFADLGTPEDHAFFQMTFSTIHTYYLSTLSDSYRSYLQRMPIGTLSEAADFLALMAVHEEDEMRRVEAKNLLFDLREHFLRSNKKGSADKRELLTKALDSL